MLVRKPLIVAIVVVTVALCAALRFETVYDISIRPRQPTALEPPTQSARPAPGPSALELRLVDSGGVGVPLAGNWGSDYSHDLRVFREAILEQPPYIDTTAFGRIEAQWHAYVDRMLAYGNNAVTVPLLLELIDFDRVGHSAAAGDAIYAPDSPFRARHAAVRQHFAPLLEWTRRRGMQVFLTTDMLALTPPLFEHLRRLAPDTGPVGINTRAPAVWDVYRAGFEELFDTLPIDGIVIRFGEGGSLYNTDGWPYRSEMAIRSVASLRAMLHGLLPTFEVRGKTLVLRSWTVGIGQLGRLHVDPRVYEAALGDIDSPALVVSTKYTAGDFFSYLPLNPTLLGARHRRLVELQAKPEFEGFGAFPDFLGEEHARALRTLRATNPRIAGTYLLTQFGGPVRAGPRTLYPVHGFWLWTDANVFVDSRLALDPQADVAALATAWASTTFGNDRRVVDAVVNMLMHSRKTVLDGYYIRAFAEREVRVPGLEMPPLMWIFEWDMVGGWHSLLSIVYLAGRDEVDAAIREGQTAAHSVRRMRAQLQDAVAAAGPDACGSPCADALRSLEYQETLFDALAAWREAFLSYYRWLDTGDPNAWRRWRDARVRFAQAATQHLARFGHDLDFPAFDLTSATNAVRTAERGGWERFIAAVVLIGVAALLAIGSPLARRIGMLARCERLTRVARLAWTTATRTSNPRSEPTSFASSVAIIVLALVLVSLLTGTLTGFASVWAGAGSPLLVGVVALAFASTTTGIGGRAGRARLLAASIGASIPGLTALFALIVYVGPLGFWYWFWTSSIFRVVLLTFLLAMLLWTMYVAFDAHSGDGWRGRVGGMLAGTGAGIVTLTALLPDWAHVLRSLDRPLNVAPATDTMLFALRTYVGVSLDIGLGAYVLGGLCLLGGYAISLTPPSPERAPIPARAVPRDRTAGSR